ncbi:Uma2 family endonuclease [Hymenobacter sp.]|uniref:Uma2 family endonuclease n=1 Tax=Hymenobacter sp. TaxID=1898978 RepID=UPI00286D581E|nr:Uma2 family endonuclease [Hymenobacter sp.]
MSPSTSLPEALPRVSPDDYLRLEGEAVEKHEYYYGEVRAMAGASYAHNRVCANMTVALGGQLRGKSCAVVGSDQRLQILSGSAYVYPDVTVVCGPPSFNETRRPETLLNPTLLVEVLSESTADKDRSEKFMLYRQIPSLQQYLMLDSRAALAELYTRQPNGSWLFVETRDLAAVLDLDSVGCRVPLAEVYAGII